MSKNNIYNSFYVMNCVPLTPTGYGDVMSPKHSADGTWLTEVPYLAEKGITFQTMICSIDLVDFTLSSRTGATLEVDKKVGEADYCITKTFVVPAGGVLLHIRSRTQFPNLVIRSTVINAPVVSLLQQQPASAVFAPSPVVIIPPPPPPPAVPPPPP